MLEVSGLSAGYGAATVVRDLSLAIPAGEAVALVGKNGMGKSTLLKALMGFLPKMGGTALLRGSPITHLPPHRICRLGVGYAAQEQALFADLPVRDNLALGLADERVFEERFEGIAALFPVFKDRLKQYAGSLSGGEQKMLLVARTLMARPALVLMDEITEGLQPTVVQKIAAALKWDREQRGTAMLLVEQHVAFALDVCDRYVVMKQGQLVEDGSARSPGAREDILAHLRV
jgi:branched-chain amino acid transport system ATP-binding protein